MAVFRIADRLHTGAECLDSLGEEVVRLGMTRLLLVTARSLQSPGVVEGVAVRLDGTTSGVFADVTPEPEIEVAEQAMADLRRAVGIPEGLHSFSIPGLAIPGIADDASNLDRLLYKNPRVLSRDDIERSSLS